jgi:hypothetical protein
MLLSNAEIKARLLAETEALLDELLESRQSDETLDDIEALASAARYRFGEGLSAHLVGEHGQPSFEPVNCPSCGQPMVYKGQKAKRLVTQTGQVTVKRAYYYCTGCRQGYFPPR